MLPHYLINELVLKKNSYILKHGKFWIIGLTIGKYFFWLVARNQCWTGDRLHCHNLPHSEKCVIYDKQEESIAHILWRHCL